MNECSVEESHDNSNNQKGNKKRKNKKRIIIDGNLSIETSDCFYNSECIENLLVNEKGDTIIEGKLNQLKNTETRNCIDYMDLNSREIVSKTTSTDLSYIQLRARSATRLNPSQIPLSITCASAPSLLEDDLNLTLNPLTTQKSESNINGPQKLLSYRSTFSTKVDQSESHSVNEFEIQSELSNELVKYFPEKIAKIMVITWNMASISTYPELLNDLIGNNDTKDLFDIYLLCFQETTSNKKDLLSRIQITFGGHYVIYNHVENGSLFCVLVGHKKFIWNLAPIGKGYLSTRLTTVTKGVTALSFQFFGITILFMGSHFSSDKGRNSLRIEDYNTILYSKDLIKSLTAPNMKLGRDEKNLSHYFDYTFWAGDLNFRIERDDVTVERLISSEKKFHDGKAFEELLENDELINSQTGGLIFQEFEEGRIMFLPTYRFVIQTDEYNDQRTPAYTDRILFRSHKSRGIECMHYDSVGSYNYSDHKPVYAEFEVNVEPQGKEHLKFSGNYNKDVYVKCFSESELKQKDSVPSDATSSPQSRMCSLQ